MHVHHPVSLVEDGVTPARVDVNGDSVPIDEEGVFEVDDESWLQRFADRHDVDPGDLVREQDGPPDPIEEDSDQGAANSQDDTNADSDDDGICGFVKDGGSKCQRSAGWGRDADTGPCKDHIEEDEEE